jgi:hypothetical protein
VFHVNLRLFGDKINGYLQINFRNKTSMPESKVAKTKHSRLWVFFDAPGDQARVVEKAEAFLAGHFQYYKYAVVELPPVLNWFEDPYDDVSWNWQLHVMEFIWYLCRAYEFTGRKVFLLRARDLIINWIEVNMPKGSQRPPGNAWNEHSTAFRLTYWLYFFEILTRSELHEPHIAETIFQSMQYHSGLLADDDFYRKCHNHGIDQDRALIAMSLMHPESKLAGVRLSLGLNRLHRQLKEIISPRGIQLEHSPIYHVIAIAQLTRLQSFFASWGIQHQVVELIDTLCPLMARFVELIVKPDGCIAPVGDSSPEPIKDFVTTLSPVCQGNPILSDLIHTGTTKKCVDVAISFPEEGYAVIRDSAGCRLPFSESFYLLFVAAADRGLDHRQSDELSFILHYLGRDILIDHGYYSYRKDRERRYIISQAAHTTVVVDRISPEGRNTSLDLFKSSREFVILHGSQRNYPGLEHVRWLAYIKPDIVIVFDELGRPETDHLDKEKWVSHEFEQMFHFSPHLAASTPIIREDAVEVVFSAPDNAHVVKLTQLEVADTSLFLAKGEREPLLGWTTKRHGELEPSPVIVSRQVGREARFVTVLDLNPVSRKWRLESGAGTSGRLCFVCEAEAETIHVTLDLIEADISLRRAVREKM